MAAATSTRRDVARYVGEPAKEIKGMATAYEHDALPPIKDLFSDYDHDSWFMGVSRARQLLAVVENG